MPPFHSLHCRPWNTSHSAGRLEGQKPAPSALHLTSMAIGSPQQGTSIEALQLWRSSQRTSTAQSLQPRLGRAADREGQGQKCKT